MDSVLFQGYCFFWVSKLIHHGFVSNFLRFWTIQWESSILYKVDESSQQEVANVKPVQRRSWQDTLLIPVVYYIYIYIDRLIMIHFYPIMYIWINYIYIDIKTKSLRCQSVGWCLVGQTNSHSIVMVGETTRVIYADRCFETCFVSAHEWEFIMGYDHELCFPLDHSVNSVLKVS